MVFTWLGSLPTYLRRFPVLEGAVPLINSYTKYLEAAFGPAYKYNPSSTQVMLVRGVAGLC